MKIVVDIKNEPRKNDLLIFNGNEFETITKDEILGRVDKEIIEIKKENVELKNDLKSFKEAVNTKLKEYHDILKIISKGE